MRIRGKSKNRLPTISFIIIFCVLLLGLGFYSKNKSVSSPVVTPTITSFPLFTDMPINSISYTCQRITLKASVLKIPDQLQAQTQQFKEDIINHYYDVHGGTQDQILKELNKCALIDTKNNNTEYFAATLVSLQWWYWDKEEDGLCKVDRFIIHQNTDFFYPRWIVSQNVPLETGLEEKWENYIDSVQIHEDGHRNHGYQVRDEIIRFIKDVEPRSSCNELRQVLSIKINSLINSLNQRGLEYDIQTQHGVTQLKQPNILNK